MKSIILSCLIIIVIINLYFILSFYFIREPLKGQKLIYVKNQPIYLEIASTDDQKSRGLSGRYEIPLNTGMLFTFDKPGFYYFWMKDMQFPLDFVWIRGKEVVEITENVSFIKPSNVSKIPSFTAKQPFDKVIELNAGMIKKLNINKDDYISI